MRVHQRNEAARHIFSHVPSEVWCENLIDPEGTNMYIHYVPVHFLCVCLYIYLHLCIYLFILFIYLFILFICLFILFICLFTYLFYLFFMLELLRRCRTVASRSYHWLLIFFLLYHVVRLALDLSFCRSEENQDRGCCQKNLSHGHGG